MILAIIAFCIIRGLMLGLISSISSLVAVIAGIFLSKRYYIVLADVFKGLGFTDNHGIFSYVLVFFIFFTGFKLLFIIIKQISSSTGLTSFDRILGVALGLAKGVLLSGILITVVQVAMPPHSAIIAKSTLLPYCNKAVSFTGLIPKDFIKYYEKKS
jgi:membrane protein required for colicin V production